MSHGSTASRFPSARRPRRGSACRSAPGSRVSSRASAAAASTSSGAGAPCLPTTMRSARPVSRRPAWTSGSASSARRKATLVGTPRIDRVRQRGVQAAQRAGAVRAPGDDLGQHRVVGAGDGRRPGRGRSRPGRAGRSARAAPARCRRSAGSRAPGPRRRRGPRRRGRRSPARRPGANGSRSPAATRSCHSTRSRPETSSVTGCSTWSRVFISMKKNSNSPAPGLAPPGAAPGR